MVSDKKCKGKKYDYMYTEFVAARFSLFKIYQKLQYTFRIFIFITQQDFHIISITKNNGYFVNFYAW